jgi:hypothetical protein
LPAQIFLLDLATGRKQSVQKLVPPDPSGLMEIVSVQLTPDAASYALQLSPHSVGPSAG